MKLFLQLFGCALLATASAAHALLFSIDAVSPSVPGVSPADILAPGPVGGPPVVAIPFAALGLIAGDDVNAIAYAAHTDPFPPLFSVDRLALGAPGTAVAAQFALGQAAGDIFLTPVPTTNVLFANQSTLGLLPAVGPGVLVPPPPPVIDNLDALELLHPGMPTPAGLFYTLTPGSPTLAAIPATAADILTTGPGGPMIAISFAALSLVATDVVDALLLPAGPPIFSLAPGSPSLGAGLTPGDLLVMGAAGPVVVASAAMLGLLPPTDNLDAVSAIPEARSYAMMLAGLVILALAMRKRRTFSRASTLIRSSRELQKILVRQNPVHIG